MERSEWLAENRAAIERRLSGFKEKKSGVLFFEPSGEHFVVVDKVESYLRLWLATPTSDLIQSKLDLDDPLALVSPYSQAAMLGLAWNSRPERICVLGLGGGRLPLAWHHYLPEVVIECAEIDPVVITAARRFFALEPDERLRLVCHDGRDYLARQAGQVRYDLILVDAFPGSGDGPYHLATREFYQLCRACLAQHGLVMVNILHLDSLYTDKIKTLQNAFAHLYFWPAGQGNGLVIATDGPPLDRVELTARTRLLLEEYEFPYPLLERLQELKIGPEVAESAPGLEQARLLVDGEPSAR